MKITFTGTEEEKESFLDDLMASDFCPFHSMSCGHNVCLECLRKNIEWQIEEGEQE